MPYIFSEARKGIKKSLTALVLWIHGNGQRDVSARVNYAICKLFVDSKFESYHEMAGFISGLEMAKLELYRRFIAPHENKAMKRNGDL